jgi:hypothetical protein
MQKGIRENKQLFLKYEILRARLEIREFFLKTAVKEVYENIGQVLSLVRMQLAVFDPKKTGHATEEITQSGDLVGQSIKDLRSMCRSFYPDHDLLKENGFIEGLESTLRILDLSSKPSIKIKGILKETSDEAKLIVFKMLLNILIEIKETGGTYKSIVVSYEDEVTKFTIRYNGEPIDINVKSAVSDDDTISSLTETADFINGGIYAKKSKTGINSIILQAPLKISL